jgi:superfamily II DNA or RNA helicase
MFFERDYQTNGHTAIINAWRTHQSALLVLPTGCGKTICFARIIQRMQPKRALVLAHRTELISQAKDKIERVTGLEVEIEKAEMYASTNLFHRTPVVVSSIQTQCSGPKDNRRYKRFRPEDFGVLICDESHHSTASTWKEVIDYYSRNPDLKVLGVTATPDRSDRAALGQIFQSVAFNYELQEAIDDGWLVNITQQYVKIKSLDFSHIRTTAGDLNGADLARIMEMEKNVQGICQPTIEVMHGLEPRTLSKIPVEGWKNYLKSLNKIPRRTIVFVVSVLQAEMTCNILRRSMDGVEWVCGKTAEKERVNILKRFASGETHCVVNAMVLTEGYDNPGVELVVVARPTKSRALYQQIIGRSTRTLPGVVDNIPTPELRRQAIEQSAKPFCRVLDPVGNSGRHKLISVADILGGKYSEEVLEAAKAKAIAHGKPVMISKSLTNAQIEADKKRREAAERARLAEEARKKRLIYKVDWSEREVDPFGKREHMATDRNHDNSYRSADGKRVSEKQIFYLRRAGVGEPSKMNYRQIHAIVQKQRVEYYADQGRAVPA